MENLKSFFEKYGFEKRTSRSTFVKSIPKCTIDGCLFKATDIFVGTNGSATNIVDGKTTSYHDIIEISFKIDNSRLYPAITTIASRRFSIDFPTSSSEDALLLQEKAKELVIRDLLLSRFYPSEIKCGDIIFNSGKSKTDWEKDLLSIGFENLQITKYCY